MNLKNNEKVLHAFRDAVNAWKNAEPFRTAAAMKAVYNVIYQILKEEKNAYMPSERVAILMNAVKKIEADFTDNALSVSHLAELCGVSEVYFRRLFSKFYGISPKEYIIKKRIEYAKTLLSSDSFSISEISRMCGYSEPCHFSREFSRRVGVSPNRYGE